MQEQDLKQLTLFPEVSLASPSVWLASKKVKGTTVIYGRKCSALSTILFTNAYELYAANGQDWSSTPAPKIQGMDRGYAYADMPQELVDYIKSLPEFDAAIWYEITGRKDK